MDKLNLYQAQRQSPKAVLLILLKYIRIMVRQIWPILLILLINPKSDKGLLITWIVFGIAFLSLVYSLVAYSRYYFFIQENELCVRSGVFRKKIINVPFDRIQSIDFRQNILHQLLNVVSVQVDTAGSKGNELELDAIDLRRAEELRDIVQAFKASAHEQMVPEEKEVASSEEPAELILSLSPYDLIKVGISANHLRTAGIIFAFFLGLADDVDQLLGWDIYGELEHTTTAMSLVGILATLIAIPVLIFVSFSITLVRTVLRFYGLKFWRQGDRFRVVSGLFTRNEKTIRKSKIQMIRWVTSPLKQLFGIYQMNIFQATNYDQKQEKSLAIPGCYLWQVDETLEVTMPGFSQAIFTAHKMHVRIVILMVFLLGFIPAVLFGLMAWFNQGFLQWLLVLVFPLAIWMGYLYQKKRRFNIHPDFVMSSGGIFGRTRKLTEAHKIQAVRITSSPMQRWRGLATLHLYTAGGHMSFHYLDKIIAGQARDFLLYRVEVDERPWM